MRESERGQGPDSDIHFETSTSDSSQIRQVPPESLRIGSFSRVRPQVE